MCAVRRNTLVTMVGDSETFAALNLLRHCSLLLRPHCTLSKRRISPTVRSSCTESPQLLTSEQAVRYDVLAPRRRSPLQPKKFFLSTGFFSQGDHVTLTSAIPGPESDPAEIQQHGSVGRFYQYATAHADA